MVKHLFLVLHETDAYRQDMDILTYFLAQSFGMVQSGGVLLCGDDNLITIHSSKGVIDELHILGAELMVVGKGQVSDVVVIGSQIMYQLLRRGNARDEQYLLVGQLLK